MMIRQELRANWVVSAVSDPARLGAAGWGPIAATVPGCVHTDLMRAGRIEDPYVDRNELSLRWIGQTDWRYETTFDADALLFAHGRIDLVCDGLDTIAQIELNGRPIGTSGSMHVASRFDVRDVLREGENRLVITFTSAERAAFAMQERLGSLPFQNARVPFNMIRKMACNFGWDWGPELITCGIWRPIRLEAWSGARFASVRPLVMKVDLASAQVNVHIDLESARTTAVRATLSFGGETVASAEATIGRGGVLKLNVENPALWWPVGHGDQPLYELVVETDDDAWQGRIGLRTVELDTSPDEIGRSFTLKVNGKPIFCKGFNWIPDDCFLDRACVPERYGQRIQQAIDANANMLRVWGGGIYETDDFYDICDERGVLVWQDFLFACAAYPEEEPIRSLVEQEARQNVSRLSRHPSLVIWNGCNENVWGYHDWHWKSREMVAGRTWGTGYYLDLLPKIIREIDPTRPYWAASPWSGDPDIDDGLHPNLATHGNKHVWEAWFSEDYTAYRRFRPRFCSEFGFQGPATYASIARVVPESHREFSDDSMRHRQKSVNAAGDGDQLNLRHLAETFDVPGLDALRRILARPELVRRESVADFDELHYLLSINQARALTVAVEWYRSSRPICMGVLYWQLNDCWPGSTSWSAIDGDGRPKPLYFATRRFFAPRLLTIQPHVEHYHTGDALALFAINDDDTEGETPLEITRRSFDGEVLARQEVTATWCAGSVCSIPLDRAIVTPDDPSCEVISVNGSSAKWFFDVDKRLNYPSPEFEASMDVLPGLTRFSITAYSIMRDIVLQIDRLDPDARISDQMITLMPGESFTFEIVSARRFTVAELSAPPVLQCANRFGAVATHIGVPVEADRCVESGSYNNT